MPWLEAPSKDNPKQSNGPRLPWDRRREADLRRMETETLLRTRK